MMTYEMTLYYMLVDLGKVSMAREIIHSFWKKH